MNQYGLDVNKLGDLITTPTLEKMTWGERIVLVSDSMYTLERIVIMAGGSYPFLTEFDKEATLFVEEGGMSINTISFEAQESIIFGPGVSELVISSGGAVIYLFRAVAEPSASEPYGVKRKTFDVREKYWGRIESIVSKGYAGKRMICRKGKHASMEFHCKKQEAYYIHSGKLLVRLRAGRAEDRFFEMPKGTSMSISPGLMHQRGGLEDTVILEISTRDDDSDSFLVEDGQKQSMPNLPLL